MGIFPNLNPDFLAMFPSLDPDNDLLVYGNDGFISIGTDPEDAFANRTDLSFAAVYGNWTCSIRNPLGTDVARFGTLLRECGKKCVDVFVDVCFFVYPPILAKHSLVAVVVIVKAI